MSPGNAPSPDSTPPAGAVPSSSFRGPRREPPLPILVVVIVGLVVVTAVLIPIVNPPETATSPSLVSSALPFSQARSLADPAAAGTPGGPWWAFYAFGEEAKETAGWASALYPQIACGPVVLHFLTLARPGVPSFNGSVGSGLSPWWLFEYANKTAVVLAVVVVNGTASAWATWGPGCGPMVANWTNYAIPSTGVVDSPSVATTAAEYNSAFFQRHSRINASFSLQMGVGPPGAPDEGQWWWFVTFTTCAPFPPAFAASPVTENGSYYIVDVDAATGLPYLGSFGSQARC
jgi:hypothetical protein